MHKLGLACVLGIKMRAGSHTPAQLKGSSKGTNNGTPKPQTLSPPAPTTPLPVDPTTACPPLPDAFQARPNGELLDDRGRRVYLRGVTVGGKLPLGHAAAP